jgi:hypothetical protein
MTSGREKTRDELIDELHRLAGKLQDTPRVCDLKEQGRHSYTAYRNEFGTWNEAIRAASFTPNQQAISREDLIDELHRLAEGLGESPGKREMNELGEYSYSAYRNEFGTWNKALLEAGLEPSPSKIPREDLLKALEDLAESLERIPRVNDMRHKGRYSITAYCNAFGGWNNALRAAGFRLNQEQRISNGKLLAEIERLADGDVPPTSPEMSEKGDYSISTYVRAFDSWNNALRAAGYEPHVEKEADVNRDGKGKEYGDSDRYGPEWVKKSYNIRENDGECLSCGRTQTELERYNESLEVHHVTTEEQLNRVDETVPWESEEGEEDDRPAQLVTLCPDCHREWEEVGLGPDVRKGKDGDSGEEGL